jgi:hypothetical protein
LEAVVAIFTATGGERRIVVNVDGALRIYAADELRVTSSADTSHESMAVRRVRRSSVATPSGARTAGALFRPGHYQTPDEHKRTSKATSRRRNH